MRHAVVLAILAACGQPAGFVPRPLPELVATGSPLAPLSTDAFAYRAGESLAWDVSSQGLTLGRADLAIGEQEVRSKFETGALASAFARASYELTTVIDRSAKRPIGAHEVIEVDGETTSTDATFAGAKVTLGNPPSTKDVPTGDVHTMHSALAVVRGWATPKAQAGVLYLLHAAKLYKLVLSRPFPERLHESPAIKVSARVVPHDGSGVTVSVAMWLSDDELRIPRRIEIAADGKTVTAELLEQ